MSVQTIPAIEEMTPAQRAELMEKLWKVMSKRPEEIEPPDWHLKVLKEREKALQDGTDNFIDFDEFENDLRRRLKLLILRWKVKGLTHSEFTRSRPRLLIGQSQA